MEYNFQRENAISNAHVGREFEEAARQFFEQRGINLISGFAVPIGVENKRKKPHKFDLGSEEPAILVECKSLTWTKSGRSPSAKIRGLNEALLLFNMAPQQYRKILFMMKHMGKNLTLGAHYINTQGHLIGSDIEVWEFDPEHRSAERLL